MIINIFKKIIQYIKNTDPYLLILFIISFSLRFINLGYSDYQGDEIKAFYLPVENESFFNFVLDQRKGPIQFIITYLIKFIDPSYSNEFLTRFPFALASLIAVLFFYKTLFLYFNKKVAFFASFFLATNGFFIAFARIVQYQSFVIMFMILSLWFFTLSINYKKYERLGIYLGFICWALSLLSHYDGVFIFPFVSYILYRWLFNINLGYKTDISKKKKLLTLFLSLVISGILLFSFYIPFILNISKSTMEYWEGRISGDVSGKISSSKYLFTVYQPIYVIHIYTLLFAIGLTFLILGLVSSYMHEKIKKKGFIKNIFIHSTDLMNNIDKDKLKIFAILTWILIPFIFMEIYVYIPGTHIYTYLLPMFIVIAFGVISIESLVQRVYEANLVDWLNSIGVTIIFLFIFAQSYAVFIDHSYEYPWESEKFLIWNFTKPTPVFHLSMFGFPYYRDWEGIRDFTNFYPEIKAYSTNERKTISRYYIPFEKSADEAGFFIYIKNPQSFTDEIVSEKSRYWAEKYDPVYTLSKSGTELVRIYIMEPGDISEIQKKGF